jgi:hypothetical protein
MEKVGRGIDPLWWRGILAPQHHDIQEIDPPVTVEIKGTGRLVRRDRVHLVEEEHDIILMKLFIAIYILVEAIVVCIGGSSHTAVHPNSGRRAL